MTARYKRAPNLSTRWFESEAFVITPAAIENLPGISAIVWRMLTRARSKAEIAALLHGRFPQVEPRRIADDVSSLVVLLRRKKLLVPVNAPAARTASHRRSKVR